MTSPLRAYRVSGVPMLTSLDPRMRARKEHTRDHITPADDVPIGATAPTMTTGRGPGLEPLLAKYAHVVEISLSPGPQGFRPSLSERLCRSSLWSGVVVRLLSRKQEHCQVRVDSESDGVLVTGLGGRRGNSTFLIRGIASSASKGSANIMNS